MIARTLLYRTLLLAGLAIFLVNCAWAQTGTITGTVTDSTTGEPLPGVNVVIQGTQQGSATDAGGAYTISDVESGTYTLVASFIGYENQQVEGVEVAAGETTVVDMALQPGEVGLEEIVVIGYGEQERGDLTGSVATVDGEEISRIPTPSVAQALQGQVAGVQVTPASGEPGAGAVIRIRGVGTLGNASPLFVVDGMLTDDISFVVPQNVESISVLKDASATAIYGARGANGVIIVTTKSGNYNQPTTYSFNAYYGQQSVMSPIDLVSAQQYAMLANEVVRNQVGPDADLPFPDPQSISGSTDWQDVAYRTAPIQSYQLGARGGTESITYNFSGNYIQEDGVVQKSTYQRASLRLNSSYVLSDSVELGHNIAFVHSKGVASPGGIVSAVYRADPTIAPRNEEGEFADVGIRASSGNPAAAIFYHRNEYTEDRLVGNIFVNAYFLEHFTFRTSFGLDLGRRETRNFNPEFFVSAQQRNDESDIVISSLEESSWLWENTLSYNDTFGGHSVEAVTGVTAQEFRQEVLGGSRIVPLGEGESLWFLDVGQQEGQTNFNSAFGWGMLSLLFRTNYSYLGRYLFTVTGRVDGSSRFGEENRYGFFPSGAVAWRISDEPFMEDVEFLTNLKLRASWGRTGNDKIGAYPGIPVVSGNLNAVFGTPGSLFFGAAPVELANPGVQWETTTQTDVGLETAFLDGRLSATVDYYRRVTDGILVRVPIPGYVGVNVEPFVNAAKVRNRGVDLNLAWEHFVGPDFNYRIGLVGSTIDNEVLALGQGRAEILGANVGSVAAFATRTVPGRPVGAFYGYQVAGIYQSEAEIAQLPAPPGGTETVSPGDFRFADIGCDPTDFAPDEAPPGTPEGGICRGGVDGEITSADRTFIGSAIPDFVYGINMSVTWKGINLALDFSGQMGSEVFNAKKGLRFGTENFETSFLDRWTGPGTSTTEPRVTNGGWNYQISDWYLSDGSYFKLRNVRLGYSLPGGWLGPLGVQSAQVYVNGTNLFTLTEYSGYTPEITTENVFANGFDTGLYPIPRTITVGVSATL